MIILSLQMKQLAMESNKMRKPVSVCCYLCGRQFGSKSFPFHHKECVLKFSKQQQAKQSRQQAKLPEAPAELQHILEGNCSQASLRSYNQQAKNIFKYKVLPACRFCERTFNAESLAVHLKGCSKKELLPEQKQNQVEGAVKVPRSLVCCVCGQRFGTSSLRIHYPQCIKKFNNEQLRKHRRQEDRRKPPEFSAEDLALLAEGGWTEAQMESFNQRATENYRENGMAECDNCGRRFFFEQMAKHRKNCELINGKMNLGKKLSESAPLKLAARPRSILCLVCGREYGPSSIAIHSAHCEQLFAKQQSLKPAQHRKPLPALSEPDKVQFDLREVENWTAPKTEDYNRLAFQIYNSLSQCYVCLRTFFEESLPKHLKDCESKLRDLGKLEKFRKEVNCRKDFFGENFLENVIEMNQQLSKSQVKEGRKPKMLMCPLCGRQYGVCSLRIHLPQCRGLGKSEKQGLQTVLADIRARFDISRAELWGPEQLQQYNKEVSQLYKRQALHECKYCHRTFFQDSLSKHIKHCQLQSTKRQLRRCNTTVERTQHQQLHNTLRSNHQDETHESETNAQQETNLHHPSQFKQHYESGQESFQMGISVQDLSQHANKLTESDLFTSIELVIPQEEGEDSPIKQEKQETGQKLLQIPSLKFIEIDDF